MSARKIIFSPLGKACRDYFANHAGEVLRGRTCLVAGSGSFLFEQLAAANGQPGRVISNTNHACGHVIGTWLSGGDPPVKIIDPEWAWLGKYLDGAGPLDKAAVILVMAWLIKLKADKSAYGQGLWRHMRGAGIGPYLEDTRRRLMEHRTRYRVDAHWSGDPARFFEAHPEPEAVRVACLPPRGGTNVMLHRRLERALELPGCAKFAGMTEEERSALYGSMAKGPFILYEVRRLDLPDVLRVKRFGVQGLAYVYSNLPLPKRVAHKVRRVENPSYVFFGPEDRITPRSRIDLHVVGIAAFNYYRALFLAKNIQKAQGDVPILVFVDGKLFGFLMFQRPTARVTEATMDAIFLMSDFPVPNTRYPRAAKLIVLLAKTREVQKLVSERLWLKISRVRTAVFTHRPASMKYRGLFELIRRTPEKSLLYYEAEMGTLTIKRALTTWLTKYGQLSAN